MLMIAVSRGNLSLTSKMLTDLLVRISNWLVNTVVRTNGNRLHSSYG